MKYSEARQGRCFVIRLEDGEILHQAMEDFARAHHIKAAGLIIVGGADKGSRLVVGPAKEREEPVVPMEQALANVHEVAGVGSIFPDESGNPKLHMHIACGRKKSTVTGCVRRGVKVWHVMEAILFELVGTTAMRKLDAGTGFEMLVP